MKKRTINYQEIVSAVHGLCDKLTKDYDIIVGVGRGGLIPATMIAYYLDKRIVNFGIATYSDTTQLHTHDIYQDIILDDRKHILVVDDICDTGNTFRIIQERFPKAAFDILSLFVKEGQENSVDFFSESVDRDTWLVFPWETT
jgi:xanthine phosphoribosyltransferase